jgi:acyl phosphate:glycerol-3-phosphate acyltransferase
MSPEVWVGVWGVVAFGLGSVPFGFIIVRLLTGNDVRSQGSGATGATNVARMVGKRWGAVVLALDALKGLAAMALATHFAPPHAALQLSVGLCAFLGHVFPPWLGFRGGKGVATALGVVSFVQPAAAAAGLVVWLGVLLLTRISSLASLTAALAAVIAARWHGVRTQDWWLLAVLTIGIALTHHANIRRLLARKESGW